MSAARCDDAAAQGVRVTRGIRYGEGLVGASRPDGPISRPLHLDLYEPDGPNASSPRPAVLLAFGGAFHRGSREDDTVEEGGSVNTPIAGWCLLLAAAGYVAASIDYRLVPDDPAPGDTPVVASPDRIPTSRVQHVRGILGLPPASPDMLWRGIEAASDDMAAAFRFLRAHALRWSIYPDRIAVGGFSAGARTALNAAFGERVGAAAVVSLSGFMAVDDLRRLVTGAPDEPPVLLVHGEHDLDYVRAQAPLLAGHFASVGPAAECVEVTGTGHFYPADAQLARPATGRLHTRVLRFLERTLRDGA